MITPPPRRFINIYIRALQLISYPILSYHIFSYLSYIIGSFLEEKETSLTWHYRSAERDFGSARALELKAHLGNNDNITTRT